MIIEWTKNVKPKAHNPFLIEIMSNSELSHLCGSRAPVFREPCKDWGVASHNLAEVIWILWVSKPFFLDKTIQKCSYEQKADRACWVPF